MKTRIKCIEYVVSDLLSVLDKDDWFDEPAPGTYFGRYHDTDSRCPGVTTIDALLYAELTRLFEEAGFKAYFISCCDSYDELEIGVYCVDQRGYTVAEGLVRRGVETILGVALKHRARLKLSESERKLLEL